MYPLAIVADSVDSARQISSQVAGFFATRILRRHGVPHADPEKYAVIDIDLSDPSNLPDLRVWLNRQPNDKIALFAVEQGNRYEATQAYALGATDLVPRPIMRSTLFEKLLGQSTIDGGEAATVSEEQSRAISNAVDALQTIFASACMGAALDAATVEQAGETVVSQVESCGFGQWIETVRKHHSQTYQHCLIVTGVAAAFGQHLGFSARDRRKLAFAGLLHDIGKANIPVSILEKPGPLDTDEMALMRQHPRLGFEALQGMPGLDADMLDMVLHHHEYLDGSGYPDGLNAREISDLVRIMTITDIFGALIERRSYRKPIPSTVAYQMLQQMNGKLDADLVREFEPISRLRIDE
jgi:putative nucleotidyltransferase with HDIG domain